jgi:hypothetical protein
MNREPCVVCGGDGQIANSFGGGSKRCPSCGGTGRRSEETAVLRDVTKTKASHYGRTDKVERAPKPTWPTTFEGGNLAKEVQSSPVGTDETRARLIREIIEYEGSHGTCTQTFIKKVRRQIRSK